MGTIISVFNHKGGVGKTTFLHNLSAFLAKEKKQKILVVDADPQMNLTTAIYGLSTNMCYNNNEELKKNHKQFSDYSKKYLSLYELLQKNTKNTNVDKPLFKKLMSGRPPVRLQYLHQHQHVTI